MLKSSRNFATPSTSRMKTAVALPGRAYYDRGHYSYRRGYWR
jgi:hypothetical protein